MNYSDMISKIKTCLTTTHNLTSQLRLYSSSSSSEEEAYLGYKVKILTGKCRSAGTPCGGGISFIGDKGKSEFFPLGDSRLTGFETGAERDFHIEVDSTAVGALRSLRVMREDPASSVVCNGWFIEKVLVKELASGLEYEFSCRQWLGKVGESGSLGGSGADIGPVERELTLEGILEQDDDEMHAWRPSLKLYTAAAAVPHPAKVKGGARATVRRDGGHGGEDAYFLTQHSGVYGLGVSDGVYMWRTQGIDAGEFSRGLMTHASTAVASGTSCAQEVLKDAAAAVKQSELKGSATVCIVTVDLQKRMLRSANLGDSGFLLLRDVEDTNPQVLYATEQQEHEFGRPFQLGHHEHADAPEDAMCWSGSIQEGDVIIAGSDGLWDNVEDRCIMEQARDAMKDFKHKGMRFVAKTISDRLTALAYTISTSTNEETPYSRDASEAFDMIYSGGKKDDICVVVAIVDDK
eukprot:CAMPEP_0196584316 /NCGR_PEP_ID=MMETSP1081-20130531/46634_1 /TAXON_ID=36882 /ORGANISM="Pyramimonas amylifera, Strain CCMP720" /LENGTH=462 /DNA_ID=CAMNT_0041905483 /DNA_START=388 /DNA_END=1776 /DNA_ORIENTATION=+